MVTAQSLCLWLSAGPPAASATTESGVLDQKRQWEENWESYKVPGSPKPTRSHLRAFGKRDRAGPQMVQCSYRILDSYIAGQDTGTTVNPVTAWGSMASLGDGICTTQRAHFLAMADGHFSPALPGYSIDSRWGHKVPSTQQ